MITSYSTTFPEIEARIWDMDEALTEVSLPAPKTWAVSPATEKGSRGSRLTEKCRKIGPGAKRPQQSAE